MTNILVITSSIDGTVDYMIKKYSERVCFFRINIDMLDRYAIQINGYDVIIKSPTWEVAIEEINSIYYRKPMLPDLSNFYPKYRQMISRDIISMIDGIVNGFDGKVLSKPYLLKRNENKVYQLKLASEVGLKKPISLVEIIQ